MRIGHFSRYDVAMVRTARRLAITLFLACVVAAPLQAQDLSRGTIIDAVTCAGDSKQTYALYLPSAYSRDREWSVLIAFHPAARGRAMVEKYQAAAERYGYIVAGSNTSRNGPWRWRIRASGRCRRISPSVSQSTPIASI
jgi:hypothetical protein